MEWLARKEWRQNDAIMSTRSSCTRVDTRSPTMNRGIAGSRWGIRHFATLAMHYGQRNLGYPLGSEAASAWLAAGSAFTRSSHISRQ